jgi:lysophospholipase L1-like esterase
MSAPTTARRRRPWRRLWLVLPSTLFALVAAECVLRIVAPAPAGPKKAPFGESEQGLLHQRSQVPGLSFELAPDRTVVYQGVSVHTNSLGMRDAEPKSPKPLGELRVAALGDSVTFGWAVRAEEAWPAVLERLIQARRPCDVLNFGVSGYSSRDEAVVLRAKALPLQPDVIVVGYFLNDPEANAVSPLHLWFQDAPWWERTRIVTLLTRKARADEMRKLGGGNFYRWLHAREGAPWKSAQAALADIASAARAANVPVLVAIFPTWFGYADLGAYPYEDLHAQVASEAEKNGLKALDLLPAFRASGLSVAELKVDDEHPSARGQEIAARAIFAALEERKWLDPAR